MFNINNTCASSIKDNVNNKIYNRNIPSQNLQPYLNVRPVSTKYSLMPIVDPRKSNNVSLQNMPTYNINNTFSPSTSNGPWSGYASNINVESILKNQVYALQKSSQSVYVPNSNSDLYNYKFHTTGNLNNNLETHNLLFSQQQFNDFNPNPSTNVIGINLFNNSTREQLKDITKPNCN